MPIKTRFRIDRTLALVALAVLMAGCFLVLQPFLTAILWSAILCTTMWPLFERSCVWLNGRVGVAAFAMVTLVAIALLAPFAIVGVTIAENADRLSDSVRRAIDSGPPDPPTWVASIPVIGEYLASTWAGFAHDTARVFEEARKYTEPARKILVASGATLLNGILQLTLSVLIAFFFFRDGDSIIDRARAAIEKLAGERGHRLAMVATHTVRGVVIGVLGTALAQGVLMAIALWIAGVKAAPLLGLATFFLSPVPIGPPLVYVPVGIFLLTQGATGWGIFILAWGFLVVSSVDNVLRPLLISRGSDLPFVLMLLGVLGGAVAFGFIGVFLGPVLIAVGYALIKDWAASVPPVPVPAATPAAVDTPLASGGGTDEGGAAVGVREPRSEEAESTVAGAPGGGRPRG